MSRGLPPGLTAYRRTPVFTETTLPAALRQRHRTKAGVWGVVNVVKGRLRLTYLDPPRETVLDPETSGVIAPEEPHEVEPLGAVRFFVEFHAPANSDSLAGGACHPHVRMYLNVKRLAPRDSSATRRASRLL